MQSDVQSDDIQAEKRFPEQGAKTMDENGYLYITGFSVVKFSSRICRLEDS